MGNKLGTRVQCAVCGSAVVITRTGSGALTCCDQEMEPVGAGQKTE